MYKKSNTALPLTENIKYKGRVHQIFVYFFHIASSYVLSKDLKQLFFKPTVQIYDNFYVQKAYK